MAIQIVSGATSDLLTVDPTSKAARVSLYDTAGNPIAVQNKAAASATQSMIPVGGLNDQTLRLLRVDRSGTMKTGYDTLLFHEDVEGTSINTQVWTATVTTWTQSQAAATGIRLNNAAGVAANSASQLVSQRQFWKSFHQMLRVRLRLRVIPATNTTQEFGLHTGTGTTVQVPLGAFWRYTTAGTVVPVLSYNGADITTGTNIASSLSSTNYYTWGIIVDDDSITYTCQRSDTGVILSEQVIQIPLTQAKTFNATHLPLTIRMYVGGSAAGTAPDLYIGEASVIGMDINSTKMWHHQLAQQAQGGELVPTTFAQSATWANSAIPTAAVLSNTAASYTTLGGLFTINSVAGAATDFALFGYTVPSPYSFYCTGIHISLWNTVVAVATTPTLFVWGVSANGSTINLSTGTQLRVGVGVQSLPVGTAAGASATDIDHPFEVPLRTEPGRIFIVILRMPVGSATATEVYNGIVTLRGYHE